MPILLSALPHRIPEEVAGVLEGLGVPGADLFVADYPHRRLLSLLDPTRPPLSIDHSVEGRAFAAQRVETTSDGDLLVPVSARGERRGVLRVPPAAGPSTGPSTGSSTGPSTGPLIGLDDARRLGEEVALALAAADRVTDRYLVAARTRRLTVAAEMQWALLPGTGYREPGLELAARLEPAYAVAGDAFDWSRTSRSVQIVVCDGGGRGVAAAQVAGVALAALRNARRVGAPLADQAQLADQALFSHYGGKHYLPTVLLEVDLETLRLDVVDAGSPRVLHLPAGSASASPTVLNLDPQMPLGMFEDTPYEVQSFSLQRGDRLVVLTDGVTEPAPRGEAFVDAALGVALRGARLLPAAEAVRWVLRALGDHLDETDPDDDAAVLCLDLPAV